MGTKFVTMGEIMLRMTRPDYQRIVQGRTFNCYYGGSEANVGVSLACMGDDVDYITRLPDNHLGRDCRNELRRYNVGTENILWGGERIGEYFTEQAAALRGSGVCYDRAHSSMTALRPHEIDWQEVLRGARAFHWSGISCALSKDASDATLEALDEALRAGIYTSLDINYRKNLWKYGVSAMDVLMPAAKKCHIIFGDTNEWQMLMGEEVPPFRATSTGYEMDIEGYGRFLKDAQERLPMCRHFILAMRNVVSANHHFLTGVTYDDGVLYHTGIVEIDPVLDQIGVGDAFMAAFLHAHFRWPGCHQWHLDYALTASAMKNSVMGDFNLVTEQEVTDAARRLCAQGIFRDDCPI